MSAFAKSVSAHCLRHEELVVNVCGEAMKIVRPELILDVDEYVTAIRRVGGTKGLRSARIRRPPEA